MWEHNHRARAFYVKCGFTDVGEHVFLFGTDPQTDRVMARAPMKTRRLIGMSIVATGVIWFQVAGRFEARRIDEQREAARRPRRPRAASLRVDSDRLMEVVTTLADPKFEGRAAGSPGGLAARAWVLERFKSIGLQPVSGSYVFPFTFTRMTMTGRVDGEGANVLGHVPRHRHQGARASSSRRTTTTSASATA